MILTRSQRITATTAGAVVALVLLGIWALYIPIQWGSPDTQEIVIKEGQGLSQIANTLKTAELVRSATLFKAYVIAIGDQDELKAGTYLLSQSMSLSQIAHILSEGLSVPTDIEVVIPEGFNIWEVDKRLSAAGLIKEGELAKAYPHKEGHLFPDTYRFAPEATLEEIVRIMEANFMAKTGVRSDIVLIIASMLEKEAKTPEDMALVAGIIEKRMEQGMLLQIDATVGYGWCVKRFAKTGKDCDVTQAPIANELKIDGPYNTYVRAGLPVAAISNPGINALKAAANPTKSDYLYYLSTRDGSQIIYSKTAAEHLRNRQKYLGF